MMQILEEGKAFELGMSGLHTITPECLRVTRPMLLVSWD